MNPTIQKNFRLALAICFGILLITVSIILDLGKTNSFVLINSHYSGVGDLMFPYITYLGDGLIYIPVAIYCFIYHRKYLVAIISGIFLCTLLTQVLKQWVYPEELRPFSLEAKQVVIHKIKGIELFTYNSFPSGHTGTAFTMALLLAAIMRKKIVVILLPFLALLVAYSRVYLAQHFVTDVCAGMIIGIISACLSLLIYKEFLKRQVPGYLNQKS